MATIYNYIFYDNIKITYIICNIKLSSKIKIILKKLSIVQKEIKKKANEDFIKNYDRRLNHS